jgi:signal peptidase I
MGTGTTTRRVALGRLGRAALRGALLVLAVQVFVVQVSVVRGHSMEPCLHDGDRLVVDRVSVALSGLERFDVVVLGNPTDPTVDYVKRVVGLPGDRVRLHRGVLMVNDRAVPEDFAPIQDAATTTEVLVPGGFLWVLGDNRPISRDSRDFGLVPVDLIRGKVRVRFWPPARLALW